MFRDLLRRVRMDVVRLVMTVELRAETAPKLAPPPMMAAHAPQPPGALQPAGGGALPASPPPASRQLPAGSLPNSPTRKISRNARCPCGSGKKYKHCHGRVTA
ncbi:MAG: SEC-C metal-binding domain-containing protein, partial [Hyphomicrobiales bacterium]|nr:SEC-C metal-binding domain-containing protein [Hyphomicrobiales bacterium]